MAGLLDPTDNPYAKAAPQFGGQRLPAPQPGLMPAMPPTAMPGPPAGLPVAPQQAVVQPPAPAVAPQSSAPITDDPRATILALMKAYGLT